MSDAADDYLDALERHAMAAEEFEACAVCGRYYHPEDGECLSCGDIPQ